MNKPRRILTAALLTLMVSGPVLAHDDGRYPYYSNGGWSGAATVYGGSQGISAWSGTLGISFGYPAAPVPVYLPRVVALPPPHVHGPACGHYYAKPWRKPHKHRHGHGHVDYRYGHDGRRH